MKWLKKQHHREVEIPVILMSTIGKNVEEKKKTKHFPCLYLAQECNERNRHVTFYITTVKDNIWKNNTTR